LTDERNIIKNKRTLNENKDEKTALNGSKNLWFNENITTPTILLPKLSVWALAEITEITEYEA